MLDERVRDLLDFSLYLDISDEVKLNWKIQRDMEERGHSLESILASIEARKPDFDAYVAPQKKFADLNPCYLFDESSKIPWEPPAEKLSSPAPGLKLAYGPEEFMGSACQVLEMDGTFDNIQELVYVESQLSNTSTKFYGELTQAMLALADAPGSNNGTGLMQTLAAF